MDVLTLDIGGTKIAGGIVSFDPGAESAPQVRFAAEIPTQPERGGADVAARAAAFACELLAAAKDAGVAPTAIGVSSAGVIDSERGVVVSATDLLPGWAGTALADILTAATGLPAAILNDVHAHALGELHWGAGCGHSEALVVAVGTGIGGAVIRDGRLAFGAHGLAGHLGHTTYLDGPYLPCSCGRSGHVEAIASGSGVANLYRFFLEHDPEVAASDPARTPAADGFAVYQRAEAGDPVGVKALATSARALGQALGNLANCFDPSVIVLSGSMTRSGDIWWQALRAGYQEQAMDLVAQVPIELGKLGGKAPLFGAAAFTTQR